MQPLSQQHVLLVFMQAHTAGGVPRIQAVKVFASPDCKVTSISV